MDFEISEADVMEHAFPEVVDRGEDYFERGAVVSLVRRGDQLLAEVQGSESAPYQVTVTARRCSVDATCTCPYRQGGWCKHIVAALLAYQHQPEAVDERPAIETLLAPLSREQLQQVLVRLVRERPSLADVVEGQVQGLPSTAGESPSATAPVDLGAYRRRVRAALYDADPQVVITGGTELDDIWAMLERDDARNALMVLGAITEEFVGGWEYGSAWDDGEYAEDIVFDELARAWTEALLAAELSEDEREAWGQRLENWSDSLDEYLPEDVLWPARAAAAQGWDHPLVRQVLRGEDVWDLEAADDEDSDVEEILDGTLVTARLNILQRQGRVEEFLNLSRVAGDVARHAAMLARLGRVREAARYGLAEARSPDQALAVAQAVWEQGERDDALRVAEAGLGLLDEHGEPRRRLAIWLRDRAETRGEPGRALAAAVVAFEQRPDLASYRRVQELAREEWPARREALLAFLRRSGSRRTAGGIEVLLHEGLIDDAIAAIEAGAEYRMIRRVAEEAVASRPEWVIQTCREQADEIMDHGMAQYYGTAVDWLRTARRAYRAAGRQAEWNDYLSDLIEKHRRKRKLRPMLEQLDR